MRFSLKWVLVVMVYVAVAVVALAHPERHYPDLMWCFTILANAYAAAVVVCGRERRRAAGSAFLVASVVFAGLVLFSVDLPGHDGHSGFYPVDNIFLALGTNWVPYDGNIILRIRTANAIGSLVFGLIGAVVGLVAYRAASCGDDERCGNS